MSWTAGLGTDIDTLVRHGRTDVPLVKESGRDGLAVEGTELPASAPPSVRAS